MDRKGLITTERENLDYFKVPYACKLTNTDIEEKTDLKNLLDMVRVVKPTILIGTSTASGAFNEKIIREMASHIDQPIIFPLSNPISLIEAVPEDIIKWTNGKALVATGSPFKDVMYNGKEYPIAQCNNALIFPGLGLGIISSQAMRVTSGMMDAAIMELASSVDLEGETPRLLPEVSKLQEVSKKIGVSVARQAILEGVSRQSSMDNVEKKVESNIWEPIYRPYKPLSMENSK